MSFFDKIKAGLQTAKNRVTGDYGKVTLTLDKETVEPGDKVAATIEVCANDQFKANKILIYVNGEERRELDEKINAEECGICAANESTLHLEISASKAFELEPGQSMTFHSEFEVPPNCQPTFHGKHITHKLTAEAVVDIPWGVGLRDAKGVTVAEERQDSHPAKMERRNASCNCQLSVSEVAPVPGMPFKANLTLNPLMPFKLGGVVVKCASLETVRADIVQQLHRHRAEEVEIPREDRMVPVEVWKTENQFLAGASTTESPLELELQLILPKNCAPTYRGVEAKHQILLQFEIDFEEQQSITFQQELFVYPGDFGGPEEMLCREV